MSHKSRERPDQRQPAEAEPPSSRWYAGFRRRRGKEEAPHPHLGDVPPPHDQPWIPKSGLVGRLRRSARRQ